MEQSYKEKYEQALSKAKDMLNYKEVRREDMEYIFSELAESKDEEIRKAIIEGLREMKSNFHTISSIKIDDAIAWLEKQKDCEHIKKDWLEHIKQSWYKEGFIDGKYSGGTSKEWTINDATILSELIDFLENGTAKLQHDLTKYANWLKIQFTPIEKQGEQKFEIKTAEESLGIDFETYDKIVDECIFDEQKSEENKGNIGGISPNWSEEDEQHIDSLLKRLDALCRNKFERTRFAISEDKNWLQSLKDRVGCEANCTTTKEWSDDDKRKIDRIYSILRQAADTHAFSTSCRLIGDKECMELQDFLKSLRPQNHWKPNDEQIKVCKEVYADILSAKGFDLGTVVSELNRMEEQLKKL